MLLIMSDNIARNI